MSTPNAYNPIESEKKWYDFWMEKGIFKSVPDERPAFTIVIPPPNVTGVLHMGHTLNNTIQDILIRKARMSGFNACWVPGTDHASIATEAKVAELLRNQGVDKFEIGREKFLEHAFEWKEKYGGIILEQLKKLGASCDWDRTAFTMDETRYAAVIDVFNRLYEKGLIYRGLRMINWDPKAKTALSDEEVNHVESTDKLYYVNYAIEGTENEFVTIATTRPETIMADVAVCINPGDERFTHLKGKKVRVPLVERSIPIVEDEYVDIEFGTGCLKITPAHDINDYEIGKKHDLPIIDILNDDGTLNDRAVVCIGEDREVARKNVANLLEEKGVLVKVEDLTHNVGRSERTGAVIEPKLSRQWFCKMGEMAGPALDMVMSDEVQFHPAKFKNVYRHWMENIRDWCISRQLWWGHRIPAWHLPNGQFVVAQNEIEALEKAQAIDGSYKASDLQQDEDVLDTWFSSWLWPIAVFDGIENSDNEEINYYYPTDVIVTAPEIIFFWVARMIMAGADYRNTKPFKHVYFTGIVRDDKGRKMSKQLGNSPDLFKLIDKHGADGVRYGTLISSPAGNDLLFDLKLCEQGSNFINKIWNANHLIQTWSGFDKIADNAPNEIVKKNEQAIKLFESRLSEAIGEMDQAYKNFKISEALQIARRLIWDDFCQNLLEWVKPKKDTVIDRKAYDRVIELFEACLKLLHPIMPFITEEVYQLLADRKGKSISTDTYPIASDFASGYVNEYLMLDKLVSGIRNHKTKNEIPLRNSLNCIMVTPDEPFFFTFKEVTCSAAGIASFEVAKEKPEGKLSFIVGTTEVFDLDTSTEISEDDIVSIEDEIKRLTGFLIGICKKLENERFVNNAPPAVIENERKKKNDTEQKIGSLKEKLSRVK